MNPTTLEKTKKSCLLTPIKLAKVAVFSGLLLLGAASADATFPSPQQITSRNTSEVNKKETRVIGRKDIDRSFNPDDLPHSEILEIEADRRLTEVVILTHWGEKRPTEIKVYEFKNNRARRLLGEGQFFTYLENVCGYQFNSKCQDPDRLGSATAGLKVPISKRTTATDILIEIDGLLNQAERFVIVTFSPAKSKIIAGASPPHG